MLGLYPASSAPNSSTGNFDAFVYVGSLSATAAVGSIVAGGGTLVISDGVSASAAVGTVTAEGGASADMAGFEAVIAADGVSALTFIEIAIAGAGVTVGFEPPYVASHFIPSFQCTAHLGHVLVWGDVGVPSTQWVEVVT